jgi:phosphate-selective porin OprO/OprP
MRFSTLFLALSILCLAFAGPSFADEADRIRAIEKQLEQQTALIKKQAEQIERLKTGTTSQDGAAIDQAVERYLRAKEDKGDLIKMSAGYDGGFFIEGGKDKSFRLNVNGWSINHFSAFEKNTGETSTWGPDENRLAFSGHVWRYHEFKLDMELLAAPVARYVFYNMHYWDEAQIKIGQFKQPFGFNQLRAQRHQDFAARGLIAQLAPGYDLGAMVHGTVLDGYVNYALGFFNGGQLATNSGRNATDANSDKDVAGRIVLNPLIKSDNEYLKHMQMGFNWTWGVAQSTASALSYSTSGGTTFFNTGGATFDNDKTRYRLGAHWAWRGGPASLSFEWSRIDYGLVDVTGNALTQADDLEVNAFNVEATWVLTGEEKGWKTVVPDKFFNPHEGGWGAWELAFRYGYLNLQNNDYIRSHGVTGNGRVSEYTFGVNWYMNPHTRFRINYNHAVFSDDLANNNEQTRDPDSLVIQYQINF